jgi:hypothetical protein
LGRGERIIAVRAGWPGVGGEVIFAPSSRLSVGPRLDVVYGGPLMDFPTGIGVTLSAPIRFHVYGHDRLDLAIALRPDVTFGQAKLIGQTAAFGSTFGMAFGLDAGARLGFEVKDELTLVAGLEGEMHVVNSPDANETRATGAVTLVMGVEAALSMSTLLFAELEGGYGFAPDFLFGGDRGVLRMFVGVAFIL